MKALLEWKDSHNPHTLGGGENMFYASNEQFSFDIVQFGDHKFGVYISDLIDDGAVCGVYGWLDKFGGIGCGHRDISKYGVCHTIGILPPKCLFTTIQEAKNVCSLYATRFS